MTKTLLLTLSSLIWINWAVSDEWKPSSGISEDDKKQTQRDIKLAVSSKWEENIVFEENFDGHTLDLSKWEYWEGCDDSKETGNLQCYTKDNVDVRNGTLVITATTGKQGKQFFSGRIRQKCPGLTNATFIVRARFARGNGLWSTLRLLPSRNNGRYDEAAIQYVRDTPDKLKFRMSDYYGSHPTKLGGYGEFIYNATVWRVYHTDPDTGFNEYTFRWMKDKIIFYVNKKWFKFGKVLTDPFQLVLNLGITESFNDEHSATNSMMWENPMMEIDWVRVYYNATERKQAEYCSGSATHRQNG